MNKETWKECRKHYSRREIFYYWSVFKLRCLKWYVFHLLYKITKYKHKHIWNINYKCIICRKFKREIDNES